MSNQIPLPQVNQPINPQGLPEGFSPEENERYEAAQARLAWLQPLLENPHFLKFREWQEMRLEMARDLALEIVKDPQNMRDRVVAHAARKQVFEEPVKEAQTCINEINARGRRMEELAKSRELERQRQASPRAEQTPNPL